MKTSQALHIAEHLWEDTIADGSLFDMMMQMAPQIEPLVKQRKFDEANTAINVVKSEIIARWANIIQEVEAHTYEN